MDYKKMYEEWLSNPYFDAETKKQHKTSKATASKNGGSIMLMDGAERQGRDLYRHVEYTDEYIQKYNKPVVWDEIAYEGNIDMGWGNISGQEMVRRFWEAALRGGHPGHGETYVHPEDILWWSHFLG